MNALTMVYYVLFSNIVRKTMENRIGKYGFRYAGKGAEGWLFKRSKDNVIETIAVTIILGYYSEVRLELYTDVLGTASSWIDSEYLRDIDHIQVTLEKFCDTFEKKGEAVLERMHKPFLKIFPSKELRMYLHENKDSIYSRWLEKKEFVNDDYKKVYLKVAEIINYLKDKPYDENVKNRLIELTVVLGEIVIKRFEWKWRWNKKQNWPDIVTKMNEFRDDPLLNVFTAYNNQQLDFFLNHYENIEKTYACKD